MKLFKKLLIAVLSVCLAGTIFAFTGCGGEDNNDDTNNPGGNTEQPDENGDEGGTEEEGETYVFEAEYTKLEGLEGFGPSGSPVGVGLALPITDASNGFCVANLGTDSPITFKITSSAQVTITLRGIFGNNSLGGTNAWNTTTFKISVNGTELNYTEFSTTQSTSGGQNFKTINLGEITLNEGENTIVFSVGDNKYLNDLPVGPSIDCIRIKTTATLTMETYEDNIL